MVDGTGGGVRRDPRGPSLVCPELIGRDEEVATLRARVDLAARGHGGVVVLVGEAGTGKSRLAAEVTAAAQERGAASLFGRAVPGTNPVPHRPLTEALLAAFRTAAPPDAPELVGFTGQLGRIVPAWRTEAVGIAGESPLVLSEAVVRLLSVLGRGQGCVLVLEDVHWADPETIATIDYLADALKDAPVLCVCTSRPEGAADEMAARLKRRDPTSAIWVPPLPPTDVDRMVAACLQSATVPPELGEFVRTHSEGSPFLVEELLAGLVASGELAFLDGRWAGRGELTPTVPASLRESIRQRLAGFDPTARRVIDAAAVLGRRFDWQLLPGVAEVDGRVVVDGLRAAVDAQLVDIEGSGFCFRHALTRESVLSDLLPPDRLHLARRAWPAIERAHPGLPGGYCELAAELAEAAGEPAEAATRLVESAHRALGTHALTTAEAGARHAGRLAPAGGAAALDADEMLVEILVAAGKPGEAVEIGRDLAARLDAAGAPSGRQVDLLVMLARASVTAGDTPAAGRHTAAARASLGDGADEALGARIDSVAAHVALDDGRPDDAAELARSALAAAERTDQPAVECEALEVLGRAAGTAGIAAARAWLQRASDVAERHRLPDRHLRARQELALMAWAGGDTRPLQETRELAARYGALVTVAVMDLSLADIALSDFDRDACLAAAHACVESSRRYGLATESVAQLWLAGAFALAGDDTAMHAAADQARKRDPDDHRILGDLHGRVLLTRSFVADDLGGLRGQLDTMMEHARLAPPMKSIFPGRALWAILHAIEDDDLGVAARAEYASVSAPLGLPLLIESRRMAEAIALGRQGDAQAATHLMTQAHGALRRVRLGQGLVHAQQMMVAGAAARDGWGNPVGWLRECEAFFAAAGYDRTARRCRIMMGEAGAPVPRRGRGNSVVPPSLRALGVTSREIDVLKLVAEGLSNKEIGQSLYLSTKTVERHLSSLFDRAGVRNRAALAELARSHGVLAG